MKVRAVQRKGRFIMQNTDPWKLMILAFFIFISLAPTAFGVSVSVYADGVGMINNIALDDNTLFRETSLVANGITAQGFEVKGEGDNIIQHQIGGQGYSISNSIDSSGSLISSASTAASAGYAVSSQTSQIAGDNGYLSSSVISDNARYIAAGFRGKGGDLEARLDCSAGHSADINGAISVEGVNYQEMGQQNDNVAVAINGLYQDDEGGLGRFGIASDSFTATLPTSNGNHGPDHYQDDPRSYTLASEGYRWGDNPNLRFQLSTNSQFQNTGLTIGSTSTAIAGAASTWDAATQKKLYDRVTYSPTLIVDRFDAKNVIGWKPIDSNALAYSTTYYACNVNVVGADGNSYHMTVESDISLNSNYNWVTDNLALSYPDIPNTFDVRTVILHEMGHTYGLGDLYTLASDDPRYGDFYQIMNAYNDKQRDLGPGDVSGIQTLYGI